MDEKHRSRSARWAAVSVLLLTSLLVVISPLALQAQAATETITFDDASGQDRVLNGQYPAGIVDWGTGGWFLSAPWRQFTTKSIGFNGPGLTSGTFTFVTPRTLLQLDAYNGGTVDSTVSVACAGQTTRTLTVPVNRLLTIQTGWTSACSAVQISSSNGWNTNLDNLVLAATGGSATPTPTPVPGAFALGDVRVTSSTSTSVTIAWTTSVPATSQILFGSSTAYGSATPIDFTLVTDHSQVLTGLAPGATAHYQAVSRNESGAQVASLDHTFVAQDASTYGIWTDPVNLPVVPVGLAVLPDSRLLMLDEPAFSQQPFVFDPGSASGVTAALASNLFCSAQSMLGDGRLIVVGGHGTSHLGVPDVNVFDSTSNGWTRVANMHAPRWYPSATLLGDGRLLVVSGMIDNGNWADAPEVYDPTTNTWSTLAVSTSDIHEIEYPLTSLLPNGRTLTLGVSNGHADLLDVARATWSAGPSLPVLNGSAAHYRPGKLLLTGGGARNAVSVTSAATLDMTQFDPAWQVVAPMHYPRFDHNLTLLPDGSVLAIGGAQQVTEYINTGTLPTEVWNPDTNTWTTLAAVHEPRLYHSTSALLPDGRVVVGGGGSLPPNVDHRNVEYFSPPYLFKGARPRITAAPPRSGTGRQ